jgi:hypothetical protein
MKMKRRSTWRETVAQFWSVREGPGEDPERLQRIDSPESESGMTVSSKEERSSRDEEKMNAFHRLPRDVRSAIDVPNEQSVQIKHSHCNKQTGGAWG